MTPDFLAKFAVPPTYPLRPITMNNARTFCITAAAGTELAGTSFVSTVIIFPTENALQRQCLHHIQILTRSGFRPLPNIPHCWPVFRGLEPCFSSDVAVHSPKSAMDHKLGRAITSPTT